MLDLVCTFMVGYVVMVVVAALIAWGATR